MKRGKVPTQSWSGKFTVFVLHSENSGFAHATLPWHISTFHGYQILFSNGRGISDYVIFGQKYRLDLTSEAIFCLVRDSSVIRWLFVRLAEAVGRQSALAADLPLHLCVAKFPRFVAIGFYFLSETLI
jgi:hypothetical protein